MLEQVLADRYRLVLSVFREGLRQREKFNERRAVRHWRAALFCLEPTLLSTAFCLRPSTPIPTVFTADFPVRVPVTALADLCGALL